MSTVLVGTNRFYDCEHVLAIRGEPILTVNEFGRPPVITLILTQAGLPARLQVERNQRVEGAVTVNASMSRVEIIYAQASIVVAETESEDIVRITLDLRPAGLNVYTEGAALQIGGARISSNSIGGSRFAISIG